MSQPPTFQTNVFNSSFFEDATSSKPSPFLTGVAAGTAAENKALVLNASRNINNINSVGTTTLVLGGTSLGATQAGYLTGISVGLGTANKALVLDSNGDLGNIRLFRITSAMGIGTNTPSVPLDIPNGSVSSTTIVPTNTGYGWLLQGGAGSGSFGTTTTGSLSIRAGFGVSASAFYALSDRRIKKNIEELPNVDAFIQNVKPVSYNLKSEKDGVRKTIGYVAQDVAKYSSELINFANNDDMEYEQDGDIEGVQLSVDYTKVVCILHKYLIDLDTQLKEFKRDLEALRKFN